MPCDRHPDPAGPLGPWGLVNRRKELHLYPADQPIANPQVMLREEFDDWTVLFHPLTGDVVGVGPVGVTIWKLLGGRRTLAEIAAEIHARFEDAPDTVLEDTVAFVDDLKRRLFVTLSPDGRAN